MFLHMGPSMIGGAPSKVVVFLEGLAVKHVRLAVFCRTVGGVLRN